MFAIFFHFPSVSFIFSFLSFFHFVHSTPEGPTLTPRRKGQPSPKGPTPTRMGQPPPKRRKGHTTQEKEGPIPYPRERRANPNPREGRVNLNPKGQPNPKKEGPTPTSSLLYSWVRPGPPLQDRAWSLPFLSFWLGPWPSHPLLWGRAWPFPLLGRGPGQPRPEGPTPTPRRKGQPQPQWPTPTLRANPCLIFSHPRR